MTRPADASPDREQRWQDRLAVPVLVAALVSVPAVFLTLLDDPYATTGLVVNALSGAVLVAETAVLFLVSRDKRDWLRRNWLLLVLTLVVVLAVVLAVGPLQLLRLVRAFGALRVLRAGRIVSAARILGRRSPAGRGIAHALTVLAGVVVAGFVVVVLSDPTSRSRELLAGVVGEGPATSLAVAVAGLLLGVATFVVVRYELTRSSDRDG